MLSLIDQLENLTVTIMHGPQALHCGLFSGPVDRVLLGLKTHANTISHSRLTALEASFPRTREAMGEAEFNAICRNYCETAAARASNNNRIGSGFAAFTERENGRTDLADLARIEWASLQSYHAADALVMSLAMLANLDETALLQQLVATHPAARIIKLNGTTARLLPELGGAQLADHALITRPEMDVMLTAATPLEAMLFDAAANGTDIGNLLGIAIEHSIDAAALTPLMTLINAGALIQQR
jgi:hypothetical protein